MKSLSEILGGNEEESNSDTSKNNLEEAKKNRIKKEKKKTIVKAQDHGKKLEVPRSYADDFSSSDDSLLGEEVVLLDMGLNDNLKIFDEQKHQACTNVSPQLIKENIRYVLQSEYKDKVIIRTPLIPTMSATDENIHQIVKFLIQINPEVKYEMLNYNPLASAKYELVNLKYGLESYQMFTKQQMQHFYDVALQAGIKNLIKE